MQLLSLSTLSPHALELPPQQKRSQRTMVIGPACRNKTPHAATKTPYSHKYIDFFFKVDIPASDARVVLPLCDPAIENTHCHFHHFISVTNEGLRLHPVTGEPPDFRRACRIRGKVATISEKYHLSHHSSPPLASYSVCMDISQTAFSCYLQLPPPLDLLSFQLSFQQPHLRCHFLPM